MAAHETKKELSRESRRAPEGVPGRWKRDRSGARFLEIGRGGAAALPVCQLAPLELVSGPGAPCGIEIVLFSGRAVAQLRAGRGVAVRQNCKMLWGTQIPPHPSGYI